jgi:hypothetical protein
MNTREAILALSQSEKLKSGLIWASQALQALEGLPETEQRGASKIVVTLLHLIAHETRLAMSLAENGARWQDIERHLDQAIVMIHSGVGPESTHHLTQALSLVTSLGQRSMSHLMDRGLL